MAKEKHATVYLKTGQVLYVRMPSSTAFGTEKLFFSEDGEHQYIVPCPNIAYIDVHDPAGVIDAAV